MKKAKSKKLQVKRKIKTRPKKAKTTSSQNALEKILSFNWFKKAARE
jgi:hypothetical protein